jgi:hypothetical protein
MKLPENTLFSKYEPCCFEDLMIKGKTMSNDFLVQAIADAIEHEDSGEFCDKLEDCRKNGTSVNMDFYCESRDGFFEEDQLFAIWEEKDKLDLLKRLIDGIDGRSFNELRRLFLP